LEGQREKGNHSMVKRPDLLQAFEQSQIRNTPPDYFQNLKIFEALYEEATTLGLFPLKDPLEGIEGNIRIAKVINIPSLPR
jgi:hypothetical protein